ncbi:MAG: hypothetical protein M5R40_17695 [Anaerolineae bacterium]|nr:hypothetical protein [Anaerolineae bacterium]
MGGPGEKRTTTLDSRITCPYCGYENPVISLICKRCGRLLDRDAAAQAAQAATPARGVSAPGRSPTPQSGCARLAPMTRWSSTFRRAGRRSRSASKRSW